MSAPTCWEIRRARQDDYGFLRQMLYEAVIWRSDASQRPGIEVMKNGHFSRYIEEWGREGDLGMVSVAEGEPVGAAWYRFSTAEEPGYGFIDESVPEVAVGVVSKWRGRGIGEALIRTLMDAARNEGVRSLSLSVEEENPAVGLYERCGFVRVGRVDNAWTMRVDLGGSGTARYLEREAIQPPPKGHP